MDPKHAWGAKVGGGGVSVRGVRSGSEASTAWCRRQTQCNECIQCCHLLPPACKTNKQQMWSILEWLLLRQRFKFLRSSKLSKWQTQLTLKWALVSYSSRFLTLDSQAIIVETLPQSNDREKCPKNCQEIEVAACTMNLSERGKAHSKWAIVRDRYTSA
jgi:hypothetical protein